MMPILGPRFSRVSGIWIGGSLVLIPPCKQRFQCRTERNYSWKAARESAPKGGLSSREGGRSGCTTTAMAAAGAGTGAGAGADEQKGSKLNKVQDVNGGNVDADAVTAPNWEELAIERVLWSARDLDMRVEELANAISDDFAGKSLAVVGVATGGFIFLADLVRKIKLPVCVDLIRVQSYGNKTDSSGVANIMTNIHIDIKDKHVIVVEDIIDRGITLAALVAHLANKGVASLSVCTLLDKSVRRVVPLQLGAGGKYYRGFECPDEFVVGYGMDFAEEFRCLPYVGVLKPHVYKEKMQEI